MSIEYVRDHFPYEYRAVRRLQKDLVVEVLAVERAGEEHGTLWIGS